MVSDKDILELINAGRIDEAIGEIEQILNAAIAAEPEKNYAPHITGFHLERENLESSYVAMGGKIIRIEGDPTAADMDSGDMVDQTREQLWQWAKQNPEERLPDMFRTLTKYLNDPPIEVDHKSYDEARFYGGI